MVDHWPILAECRPDRVACWRADEPWHRPRALAEIRALAERLEPGRAYLNLCRDRYRFTIAFAAVCLGGGTNLLPPSRTERLLAEIEARHPGAGRLDDESVGHAVCPAAADGDTAVPQIAASHCAAIVFTSGSTGTPTAHPKYWGDLAAVVGLWRRRFLDDADARGPFHIAATVPPQHMYGLETSVLPVLHGPFAAHAHTPVVPWDIAETLAAIPEPRLLVTTPTHLRACLQVGTQLPPMELIISATAPLPVETARAAESAWGAPVTEIYGCTEAGSMASRRVTDSDTWRLYDGMSLSGMDPPVVSGPQLPEPVALDDELERLDATRFRLVGRSQDMVKLAGKRMSLADLSERLRSIEGIEDAAAFVPREGGQGRPAALVVAPGLDERSIGARLARCIDPVFVPRPLVRVERLPRNAMGKLPRAELESLLHARQKPTT